MPSWRHDGAWRCRADRASDHVVVRTWDAGCGARV